MIQCHRASREAECLHLLTERTMTGPCGCPLPPPATLMVYWWLSWNPSMSGQEWDRSRRNPLQFEGRGNWKGKREHRTGIGTTWLATGPCVSPLDSLVSLPTPAVWDPFPLLSTCYGEVTVSRGLGRKLGVLLTCGSGGAEAGRIEFLTKQTWSVNSESLTREI